MKHFFYYLTAVIAFLLPLHGGITVFLPEPFRWWKEVLLLLLALLLVGLELKTIVNKGVKHWVKSFSRTEIFAGLFFLWGVILLFLNADMFYSAYALRYLLLPVGVFLLVSRVNKQFSADFQQKNLKNFAQWFVGGLLVSVLFAFLFQQLQLSNTLLSFYSAVPSSWVPGQILQKWHETHGFVRWQGLSSGPIELSHLLVLGLACLPFTKLKKHGQWLLGLIFVGAVLASFSRSAVLALGVLFCWEISQRYNLKKYYTTYKKAVLFGMCGLLFVGWLFAPKILNRAGTSDHFTRPVKALRVGLKSPVLGNLAQLGPAARMKNLQENNNDQALIAENVLVDVFAQMGLVGLCLFFLFLYQVHKQLPRQYRSVFYALFLMMNLATIFDMTPISIAYFWMFGGLVYKK
ncbi:hypothetical protein CSB37_02595 [bacterium DOLZORAL124_38_8]|nr:MAG: hypothetical protein CSB37_02595 [bacterium DOLZORAL124_38_8]